MGEKLRLPQGAKLSKMPIELMAKVKKLSVKAFLDCSVNK